MSRWVEKMIIGFSWLCGLGLFAAIVGIFVYLLSRGAGAVNLKLIFGDTDPLAALLMQKPVFAGLFPAIVGTCALVLLSVSLAIPVGMASGIYMAEDARGGLKKLFCLFFDILAGGPSIVIGLFGFLTIIRFTVGSTTRPDVAFFPAILSVLLMLLMVYALYNDLVRIDAFKIFR